MMHGIVCHVVEKISDQEAGEEREDVHAAQQHPEQEKEQSRQRNAHRWNHHQPLAVARVIMMHAMKDEVHALAEFTGRLPVKDETMEDVFRKSPDEQSQGNIAQDRNGRKMIAQDGLVQTINDDGNEDEQRHAEVYACQPFQQRVLEHPDGFVLVTDEIFGHYEAKVRFSGRCTNAWEGAVSY